VHIPFAPDEEIDEEADSIGNRIDGAATTTPPAAAPGAPRSAGRSGRTRPTYPIVCASCGQGSSVPFKPQPGRPVYCQDCYQTKKDDPVPDAVAGRPTTDEAAD